MRLVIAPLLFATIASAPTLAAQAPKLFDAKEPYVSVQIVCRVPFPDEPSKFNMTVYDFRLRNGKPTCRATSRGKDGKDVTIADLDADQCQQQIRAHLLSEIDCKQFSYP